MKKFKMIMALALVLTTLLSVVAFADTSDIRERVEELQAEGYTREEIRDVLEREGFEMKEGKGHKLGQRIELPEEVKAEVDQMKADGASKDEIHDYLLEQGIELPERQERIELPEEVRVVVDQMKADGASREDVHAYLLEEGIELPARAERGDNFGPGQKSGRPELSEEVQAKVEEMKAEGASREDIHEYLESQGIEMPEKQGRPHKGRGMGFGPEAEL